MRSAGGDRKLFFDFLRNARGRSEEDAAGGVAQDVGHSVCCCHRLGRLEVRRQREDDQVVFFIKRQLNDFRSGVVGQMMDAQFTAELSGALLIVLEHTVESRFVAIGVAVNKRQRDLRVKQGQDRLKHIAALGAAIVHEEDPVDADACRAKLGDRSRFPFADLWDSISAT
jgi:hypothetical protein